MQIRLKTCLNPKSGHCAPIFHMRRIWFPKPKDGKPQSMQSAGIWVWSRGHASYSLKTSPIERYQSAEEEAVDVLHLT